MNRLIKSGQFKLVFLLFIIFLAGFLRLYRISEMAYINYDEATNVTAERKLLVTRKPTLLGNIDRIGNSYIYYGPLEYYIMAPALLAANYDPIGTYVFTAILCAAAVMFVYLTDYSLISAAFYAVFPTAVIFSRSDWLPNLILFFAPLSLLFLKRRHYFLSGLAAACAFQMHSTAGALFFLPFAPLLLNMRREDLKNTGWFFAGVILGLSPLILFDLRYNFLYLQSYWGLLFGTPAHNGIQPHYFFWLLPIIALRLSKWPKKLSVTVISASFALSVFWLLAMPAQTVNNPATIRKISNIIALDEKQTGGSFEVASFVDPDTRATAYRYFLDLAGVKPLSVEEYGIADHLYVITYEDPQSLLYNKTYEVESFHPKRVSGTWEINGESIYRLERE